MKRSLQFLLKVMAKSILWRYKPQVIGITGSIGKTLAKDAIVHAIEGKFSVRGSQKNYNNEFGVPLTILHEESPGKYFFGWIGVAFRWISHIIFWPKYPEILVLEMSIDRPGDMEYLLSIVQPSISVVTYISSSHLEFFGDIKDIAEEKAKILQDLSERDIAIVNADNTHTWAMRKKTKADVISYGFREEANFRAIYDSVVQDQTGMSGMQFKVDFYGKVVPVKVNHIIARHHIYGVLVALAVAHALKINLMHAAKQMEDFFPPKSRMSLIEGVRGTLIIDDTYNASPDSTRAAIESLNTLQSKRKILVLGDMFELGTEEESGHRDLAESILALDPERVFLIGERMSHLADELRKNNFPVEGILCDMAQRNIINALDVFVREGDIMLIKGSQAMRMEKIVKAFMARPKEAKKRICRQEEAWLRKV